MALIDNLVAYWKLDETSGTNADDAHGANNGTLVSMEDGDWQGAGLKLGLDFDGDNEFIDIAETGDLNITSNLTISAWVKPTSVASASRIIDRNNNINSGYVLIVDAGGKVQIWTGDGADWQYAESADALNVGTWYYIAATWTNNFLQVYINGSANGNSQAQSAPATHANAMRLGAWASPHSATQEFNGVMDEVAVWSRALNSTELTELWNNGDGLAYPFAVGTNLQLNIGDSWKTVDGVQINIGDSWKTVAGMQINIGDAWKTIF